MIIHLGIVFTVCITVNKVIADINLDISGDDFSIPNAEFETYKDGDTKFISNYNSLESDPNLTNNEEEKAPKDCKVRMGPNTRSMEPKVMAQKPRVRMIHSKKEESKEQVKKTKLDETECGTEIKELVPKTSEKIETYTELYTVTAVKVRTLTRRRKFIQRRRQIKQNINKPVLIVRRRLIKEKQTFERIIPKVVETRQIMNHPETKTRIITGPIEEITKGKPTTEEGIDVFETATECVEEPEIQSVEGGVDGGVTQPMEGTTVADGIVPPQEVAIPVDISQPVVPQDGNESHVTVRADASKSEINDNAAAEVSVKFRRMRSLGHSRSLFDDQSSYPSENQGFQSPNQFQQQSYLQQIYGYPAGYPQYGYPPYSPYSSFGVYGGYGKKK